MSISKLRTLVKVDSLCIPLTPPYSLSIPAPIQLDRPTLLKLFKLSALNPPSTPAGWEALDSLGGLVAIIEGVRKVDTSAIAVNENELIDGRVRAEPERPVWGTEKRSEEVVKGRVLLGLAQVTEGDYYVVRTPEGIRGKKKAGSGSSKSAESD